MNKLFGLFLLALACWAPGVANAANKFAFCASGSSPCTWDNTNTPNIWFTATNGGGSATTVPTSADIAIFDANSCNAVACTFNVGATINGTSNTLQGITAGACTGSTTGCFLNFASGNPSITITGIIGSGGMSLAGTGTRKYVFGSGTFTFTATSAGALYDIGTTTGLDGTSDFTAPIVYSATTTSERQFNGGGQTFGSFTVAANTSRGGVRIFSANTFASFTVAAGTSYMMLPASATTTITGSAGLSLAGTASNPTIFMANTPNVGTATVSLSSGTSTPAWIGLMGITTTGAGTLTPTNCLDFGRNTLDSGDTCTAPVVGGGGGGGRIIGG